MHPFWTGLIHAFQLSVKQLSCGFHFTLYCVIGPHWCSTNLPSNTQEKQVEQSSPNCIDLMPSSTPIHEQDTSTHDTLINKTFETILHKHNEHTITFIKRVNQHGQLQVQLGLGTLNLGTYDESQNYFNFLCLHVKQNKQDNHETSTALSKSVTEINN